jgi:iron(III) transport system ATP-binding protein
MSRLTVAGLWKGYSTEPVLRGVDLDVPAGSLTAVLGLSGCGKTTLLRVIAGFERAERGQVSLGAKTLDDGHTYVPPERRGIGYVPQEGALFPHLSVRKNVGFGLSREERRGGAVGELLEMVGLAPLAERYPHQLSGGEQQRVALARALARRPEVLLLDEPFSSLDASLRTRVREEVHALLRAQGVTTVLVTHDQEEALSLADTVAVLRDGTIVQGGTPDQLYTLPVDLGLARFLGAANLIDAAFEQGIARTPLGALTLRSDPGSPGAGAPGAGSGVVMIRPEQLEVRPRGEPAGGELTGARGKRTGAGGERTGAGDETAIAAAGAADTATAGDGLTGEVEQCRYYGHDALLHIRLDEPVAGTGGNRVLLARVQGEQALPAGTRVILAARGPVTIVE